MTYIDIELRNDYYLTFENLVINEDIYFSFTFYHNSFFD